MFFKSALTLSALLVLVSAMTLERKGKRRSRSVATMQSLTR
jgi:hypothetical protein